MTCLLGCVFPNLQQMKRKKKAKKKNILPTDLPYFFLSSWAETVNTQFIFLGLTQTAYTRVFSGGLQKKKKKKKTVYH